MDAARAGGGVGSSVRWAPPASQVTGPGHGYPSVLSGRGMYAREGEATSRLSGGGEAPILLVNMTDAMKRDVDRGSRASQERDVDIDVEKGEKSLTAAVSSDSNL